MPVFEAASAQKPLKGKMDLASVVPVLQQKPKAQKDGMKKAEECVKSARLAESMIGADLQEEMQNKEHALRKYREALKYAPKGYVTVRKPETDADYSHRNGKQETDSVDIRREIARLEREIAGMKKGRR